MKVCPECGHENREGSLACENCGMGISVFARLSTRIVTQPEQPAWARNQGAVQFHENTDIILRISDVPEPIILSGMDEIILGRVTVNAERNPHLDLTAYRAFENGVSGQHAVLQRDHDRLTLTDLASTNGTYVNGKKLKPEQPIAIRDGDEIRLGRLTARIYFENPF